MTDSERIAALEHENDELRRALRMVCAVADEAVTSAPPPGTRPTASVVRVR